MRYTYFPKQESKFTHPEKRGVKFVGVGGGRCVTAIGNSGYHVCGEEVEEGKT